MLKPKKKTKRIKLREDGNLYVTKATVTPKKELTDMKVRRTVKGLLTGAPSAKKAEAMSKMKKGGMSCSCGKASCAKCGGKKMPDGGKKKSVKKLPTLIKLNEGKKPAAYPFTPKGKPASLDQLRKDLEKRKGVKHLRDGGKHPGFKAVQESIAKKQGVSKKAAGAILASAGRKASAKAKKANPRLLKIKGNKK